MPSRLLTALLLASLTTGAGCTNDRESREVARVGEFRLTEDDIRRLGSFRVDSLSSSQRRAVVEDWIELSLLADEAIRRNMHTDPGVDFDLTQARNSLLASKLLEHELRNLEFLPSESEQVSYLESNAELFRTREQFYKIRLLRSENEQNVQDGRTALRRAMNSTKTDSLWIDAIREYSDIPGEDSLVSVSFLPVSRLARVSASIPGQIASLSVRQLSRVHNAGGLYYFFQIQDVVEPGILPELDWIREDLKSRMLVQFRKESTRNLISDLRSNALTNGTLTISELP